MKASILLLFTTLLFSGGIAAQSDGSPITIGEQFTIRSTVLDEDRSIIVGLPARYELSDASYPVLYVLDGAAHFHYTTGITEFLANNQFIPEMIVVAVNNTDRTRDLTPPSQIEREQQSSPTHGGADNFQRFFAEDLMPWVESNYRTHPYKVLVGHSFGGLFAIHTLTTRPNLFDAYIAISPSMQWNAQHLVEQAEAFFTDTPQLPVSLYMTVGNEGAELLGGTRKLAGVLDAATPKDFLWRFDHMPEETHGSVPHRSTYQGLEFVFANWLLRNPFEVYTQYGLAAVEQFHAFGDRRYGVNRGLPELTLAYLLGNIVRAGKLDDAVNLLSTPATLQNASASTVTYLADGLRDSGDLEQAETFYRHALRKNPGYVAARNALEALHIDYSDIVPSPRIAADILDRYSGVYASKQTGDMTVLVEDGGLYVDISGRRLQLHPLSESEFYVLERDNQYTFQFADDGQVSGVELRQDEFSVVADRR